MSTARAAPARSPRRSRSRCRRARTPSPASSPPTRAATDVSAPIELWTDADGPPARLRARGRGRPPEVPDPDAATTTQANRHSRRDATTSRPAADVARRAAGARQDRRRQAGGRLGDGQDARLEDATARSRPAPSSRSARRRHARGRIDLQSARDAHGRTQTGTFWGGVFQIRQRRHGKGMTDLVPPRRRLQPLRQPRAASPSSPARPRESAASSAACGARTGTRASAPTAATASPPSAARAGSRPIAATARSPA